MTRSDDLVLSGLSFTYEANRGMVLHGEFGTYVANRPIKGVPLLFHQADRVKAYTDADRPVPEVQWQNVNDRTPPYTRDHAAEARELDDLLAGAQQTAWFAAHHAADETGRQHARRMIERIDAYRAARGWSTTP